MKIHLCNYVVLSLFAHRHPHCKIWCCFPYLNEWLLPLKGATASQLLSLDYSLKTHNQSRPHFYMKLQTVRFLFMCKAPLASFPKGIRFFRGWALLETAVIFLLLAFIYLGWLFFFFSINIMCKLRKIFISVLSVVLSSSSTVVSYMGAFLDCLKNFLYFTWQFNVSVSPRLDLLYIVIPCFLAFS